MVPQNLRQPRSARSRWRCAPFAESAPFRPDCRERKRYSDSKDEPHSNPKNRVGNDVRVLSLYHGRIENASSSPLDRQCGSQLRQTVGGLGQSLNRNQPFSLALRVCFDRYRSRSDLLFESVDAIGYLAYANLSACPDDDNAFLRTHPLCPGLHPCQKL